MLIRFLFQEFGYLLEHFKYEFRIGTKIVFLVKLEI
jgi:hypothetical protein